MTAFTEVGGSDNNRLTVALNRAYYVSGTSDDCSDSQFSSYTPSARAKASTKPHLPASSIRTSGGACTSSTTTPGRTRSGIFWSCAPAAGAWSFAVPEQ